MNSKSSDNQFFIIFDILIIKSYHDCSQGISALGSFDPVLGMGVPKATNVSSVPTFNFEAGNAYIRSNNRSLQLSELGNVVAKILRL